MLPLRLWIFVLGIFLTAWIASGCKKDDSGSNQSSGASVSSPLTNPGSGGTSTGATPSIAIADTGDVNATLHQLSLELRRFVVRTRTVPRTFEEFVAKSQAQIPPPPAGKKYAIEGQAVVLVKR